MGYKLVTAKHLPENALLLVNHPPLHSSSNKVEDAAVHAKNGRVQCTVNTNFVSCN